MEALARRIVDRMYAEAPIKHIVEDECRKYGELCLVRGDEVRVIQDEDLVWDRVRQVRRERYEKGEPRHPEDELQSVQAVIDRAIRSALVIDSRQMATFVAHVTAVVYSEGCRKIY